MYEWVVFKVYVNITEGIYGRIIIYDDGTVICYDHGFK